MQFNNLVLVQQFPRAAFLLLLLSTTGGVHGQNTMSSEGGTCSNSDLILTLGSDRLPCMPCNSSVWFELILNQRAGSRNETSCFNNDPLGTQLPFPCPQDLTQGHDHPDLDLTANPRGFIITKLPFFRYATKLPHATAQCIRDTCPINCSIVPPPPPVPGVVPTVDNLDIGQVKRYYDNNASYPTGGGTNVDFQMIEWPGKKYDEQNNFIEEQMRRACKEATDFKSHRPYLCSISDNTKPRNFKMLKFQQDSSKMLHYPCNKEEGTTIVALGLIAAYDSNDYDDRPHSKIYLTYSNISVFKTYAQPLHVSQFILDEMAKPADAEPKAICRKMEPKNCDFTAVTTGDCELRRKFFVDHGRLVINKTACTDPFNYSTNDCKLCRRVKTSLTGDLSTVLDFTFVQGKLLMGMRCGILIVKGFLGKILDIRVATLLSSHGTHKNTFFPVDKIASSHCCKTSGSCRKTIVAAYSSYQNTRTTSPKEMYVSFDLGETFQAKLIAEHISALNLMWGMYRLYGDWMLYHQLFESPDPEDLKDEHGDQLHPGYTDIRSVPDWESLTVAQKEKRYLYGESSTLSHDKDLEVKKRAMRRYFRLRTFGALGRFVRYRRQGKAFNLDLSPEWLKLEIRENRRNTKVPWKDHWTDSNCDSIHECRTNFKNDDAVTYFLNQSQIIVKTPKRHADDPPFCDQIMSLVVLEEEDSLYVLCRVGFGDMSEPPKSSGNGTSGNSTSCSSRHTEGDCTYPLQNSTNQTSKTYPYNPCVNPAKFYAIFALSVKEKLPMVIIEERRSERLFTCIPVKTILDFDGCTSFQVDPVLIRVASSITLFVKNCHDVLYYSPNGGRTIFNTQFYAHQAQFDDLTSVGPNGTNSSNSCFDVNSCNKNQSSSTLNNKRQMMYRLKALDVAPLAIISRQSHNVLFMTMRNMYAYGVIGVNTEFKMIVGQIFPKISDSIISNVRSNDFVFPDFSNSGLPVFGVALKLIYSHNKLVTCELWANRHGIRLIRMDFFFYKDISYYFDENKDLDAEAQAAGMGLKNCHTHSFSTNPDSLFLDTDEGGIVQVSTFDPHPNIALGLVSSEEKSIIVDVSFVERDRKEKEHLSHDWDVHIKSIRNYKPRGTALVDSFFGVENNNMFGFHTEVGLANSVEFRCHVQPVSTVSIRIQCRDKKFISREDEHRPQCQKGTFSKSAFEYRLKRGQFDPNLAGYWMALEQAEGKELIKIDRETGDLVIVYDYLRFGCPLEPYKDDQFIPDMRIATADTNYNGTLGQRYNGSFLLIELFGAKGFKFSQTYADYGCTFLPMNLTNATLDWVHRQRMFKIANSRQSSFSDLDEVFKAKTTEEIDKLEYGNKLFHPDAVDHPINIVNRVTHRDCKQWRNFFLKNENESYPRLNTSNPRHMEHLEQELPIFSRDGNNRIVWGKQSKNVYIFMAVALDPTESLCEYYNIFGVHLPELTEIDSTITVAVFLLLILIWLLLFFCGYMYRKSRIRTLCIDLERKRRLEESAWKVVYEYEKLLQENDNIKFEEEFREHFESSKPIGGEKGKMANPKKERKVQIKKRAFNAIK